jgi:hypothetical protein
MTSRTVIACCALMHIFVTLITFTFGFLKNQCGMTLSAVNYFVLPNQRQFGGVVVKRVNFFIELPAVRTMTGAATNLKLGTVRRID